LLTLRALERIYVGKRRAEHTVRQEEINALLVRYARAGKRAARTDADHRRRRRAAPRG
jgi:siroheme synthase